MTDMKILHKILLPALLLFSLNIKAQPDLSGYWLIDFGPMPPVREASELEQFMIGEFPPDTHLLADSGLVEFPPGEFDGLEITDAARKEADAYDIEEQRQVSTTCLSPSVIYSMQGPFPMEIFQGEDMIVIKMEYFDVVRVIFMNETEHPDNWPHTITGHSFGYWEDDTLVVETAKISKSTLLNNGLNHSEDIRMTERFRLSEDGQSLTISQLYEDPAVFEGKAARIFTLTGYDDHVYPYACDPSYGAAIQNREQ